MNSVHGSRCEMGFHNCGKHSAFDVENGASFAAVAGMYHLHATNAEYGLIYVSRCDEPTQKRTASITIDNNQMKCTSEIHATYLPIVIITNCDVGTTSHHHFNYGAMIK